MDIPVDHPWTKPENGLEKESRPERKRPLRPATLHGASNQTRTDDPRFTRAVLYQLSYAGNPMAALQQIGYYMESLALFKRESRILSLRHANPTQGRRDLR